VKSTKGAIGYVDLSDAKATGLLFASIKNQGGKFVEATSDSASAAGDGIEVKDNLGVQRRRSQGRMRRIRSPIRAG